MDWKTKGFDEYKNIMVVIADLLLVLIIAAIAMANVIIATPTLIPRTRAATSYDFLPKIKNVIAQDDITQQAVSNHGIMVMEQLLTVLIVIAALGVGLVTTTIVVILKPI
jgi:hypothetical protein